MNYGHSQNDEGAGKNAENQRSQHLHGCQHGQAFGTHEPLGIALLGL
jgi:hypothetical protein